MRRSRLKASRRIYRGLLDAYFGPDFTIDPELELEGLRIPHFYSAFYVYKYATGISAAVALAGQVLQTGNPENYLSFLRSGGRRFPIETLTEVGRGHEFPGSDRGSARALREASGRTGGVSGVAEGARLSRLGANPRTLGPHEFRPDSLAQAQPGRSLGCNARSLAGRRAGCGREVRASISRMATTGLRGAEGGPRFLPGTLEGEAGGSGALDCYRGRKAAQRGSP